MKFKAVLLFIFNFLLFLCFEQTPTQRMLSSKYQGKWSLAGASKINQKSPFSKFTVDSGIVLIYFTDMAKGTQKVEGAILEFLAPKYYNQQRIKLVFTFEDCDNKQTLKWQQTKQINFELYDQSERVGQGSQTYYYSVDSSTIAINNPQYNLLILISYKQQIINSKLTLIFAVIGLGIFWVMRRKQTIQDTTGIRHESISIIFSLSLLFLITIVQFIIGCHSLFGEMNPEAFFVVSAFLNLCACFHVLRYYYAMIIHMKLMIIPVWILIISYTSLLLVFRHSYIFLILNSLIYIPEIVYQSIRGQKVALDLRFIIFICSNQIYVFYFKVCPSNIFRQSPNYLLGYCVGVLLILQILTILGQIYLGPRFFIPSFFLPKKHNYYNSSQIAMSLKTSRECYICLDDLALHKKKIKKLMITPCQHIFHAECLQKWMEIKMECPVDRRILPAL